MINMNYILHDSSYHHVLIILILPSYMIYHHFTIISKMIQQLWIFLRRDMCSGHPIVTLTIQDHQWKLDHGTYRCGHIWPEWLNIVEVLVHNMVEFLVEYSDRLIVKCKKWPKEVNRLTKEWCFFWALDEATCSQRVDPAPKGWKDDQTLWRQGTHGFVEPTGKMLTLTSSWGFQRDFYGKSHGIFCSL